MIEQFKLLLAKVRAWFSSSETSPPPDKTTVTANIVYWNRPLDSDIWTEKTDVRELDQGVVDFLQLKLDDEELQSQYQVTYDFKTDLGVKKETIDGSAARGGIERSDHNRIDPSTIVKIEKRPPHETSGELKTVYDRATDSRGLDTLLRDFESPYDTENHYVVLTNRRRLKLAVALDQIRQGNLSSEDIAQINKYVEPPPPPPWETIYPKE